MNPRLDRTARRALERANQKWPLSLVDVPPEAWPAAVANMDQPPTKVMRSRDYLVQIYIAPYPAACRLTVCRTGARSDGHWQGEIAWEELQRLKREAGYAAELAVEIFPPDHDIVNVANMRHLWIMAHDLEFRWRSNRG